MTLDRTTIIRIMPQSASVADRYIEPLNRIMPEYGIDNRRRICHFLAQLAQESGQLCYTSENLNYSADGLQRTFRKYFPTPALAALYARKPERIANRVYANRIGNGDEQSGDGWRFRGHGLIQLTGRANYQKYLTHLHQIATPGSENAHFANITIDELPDLLTKPEHAVRSACWFWLSNGLTTLADGQADEAVCEAITRRINGGTNGLTQRKVFYYSAKQLIPV